MTPLELDRTLRQLAGIAKPRIALITDADTRLGLGGTLSRAGLSYLDRNQVPQDILGLLPPFAPSSDLYRRFLRLTGAHAIAVDPRRASRSFAGALKRKGIPILSRAGLVGAAQEGQRLCVLQSRRYGSLGADVFVDASLGARLAHLANVAFLPGLGPRGLSRESIALGWIFQVQGMDLRQFQRMEEGLTRRLLDRRDGQAQQWLANWQQDGSSRTTLVNGLVDDLGRPRLAFSTTSDSADQRSPAIGIAFHGEEHIPPWFGEGDSLAGSGQHRDFARSAQLQCPVICEYGGSKPAGVGRRFAAPARHGAGGPCGDALFSEPWRQAGDLDAGALCAEC